MRYLEPGYYDADEILIHATFQTLCNFIEKEKPEEIIDWESDLEHKRIWNEMTTLYNWWTKDRFQRDSQNPILQSNVCAPEMEFVPLPGEEEYSTMKFIYKTPEDKEKWEGACKEADEWEQRCEQEDTDNLIRLIKIRKHMWT